MNMLMTLTRYPSRWSRVICNVKLPFSRNHGSNRTRSVFLCLRILPHDQSNCQSTGSSMQFSIGTLVCIRPVLDRWWVALPEAVQGCREAGPPAPCLHLRDAGTRTGTEISVVKRRLCYERCSVQTRSTMEMETQRSEPSF